MNSHTILLNNIKIIRKIRGLSQSDLAKLAGTTQNTISSIEKYKYGCSAFLAYKLCQALDVDFESLFYVEDDELPF